MLTLDFERVSSGTIPFKAQPGCAVCSALVDNTACPLVGGKCTARVDDGYRCALLIKASGGRLVIIDGASTVIVVPLLQITSLSGASYGEHAGHKGERSSELHISGLGFKIS